ncbi:MAG: FAD-dependent oxidoreductase [Minisyncoccia bacterium]
MKLTEKKKNKRPSILLIGAGRFGEKHLETLLSLEKKGVISVFGVVVKSQESQKNITKKYNVKVWTKITDDVLKSVDAVDIVTPPETHYEIAMKCLPVTDVFIEKPLAMNTLEAKRITTEAKKYRRTFMVGHIFRYNPSIKKLRSILEPFKKEPVIINGSFTNQKDTDNGRPIAFELLHLFDIVDFIIGMSPGTISTKISKRTRTVEVKYAKNKHATFKLGWSGDKKIRTIDFIFSKKEIKCDFLENIISIKNLESGSVKIVKCTSEKSPLEEELVVFLKLLKGKKVKYPDLDVGTRIVSIAEEIESKEKNVVNLAKPKVAVIGSGIFGINCALELAKFTDVTVFEKNQDIMLEASYINQYRHHWGYHYPRSDKTVEDIREAIEAFEDLYSEAIVYEFPTYYSVAKSKSKTTPEDYLKFCRKHNLPFTIEYPNEKFLNRNKISLSLKTFEPIYNYDRLKKLVEARIQKSHNLKIKFNSEVVSGKINPDGKKVLTFIDSKGNKNSKEFDYVINATYARHNKFSHWFDFPIKPVRIDLVETLIVKLPLPKISIAIMDGPFTNLVPTSKDGLFTLVHIKESMLERYVPKNGIPHGRKRTKTMIKETLNKSKEWIPILEKAEIVDVRYVHRAVNAYREHDDARPSDTTYYGFGCWSILGGKIVNSVKIAKEIELEIKHYLA